MKEFIQSIFSLYNPVSSVIECVPVIMLLYCLLRISRTSLVSTGCSISRCPMHNSCLKWLVTLVSLSLVLSVSAVIKHSLPLFFQVNINKPVSLLLNRLCYLIGARELERERERERAVCSKGCVLL